MCVQVGCEIGGQWPWSLCLCGDLNAFVGTKQWMGKQEQKRKKRVMDGSHARSQSKHKHEWPYSP